MRLAAPILLTAVLLFPLHAGAQSSDSLSTDAQPKDPVTATLITVVVPGGGHIYAGETGVGLGVLFVSAAAITVGNVYSNCLGRSGGSCSNTPLYIGIGVHVANWIYSLIDAPRAVKRHNRQLRSTGPEVQIRPVADLHGNLPAGGLQVAMHF